ncbi:hypothetical protein FIBSPDRAFT_905682, partial [Athelia psychrophila]
MIRRDRDTVLSQNCKWLSESEKESRGHGLLRLRKPIGTTPGPFNSILLPEPPSLMSSASTTRFSTTTYGTGNVQINNIDGDLHIHNVYQMAPDEGNRAMAIIYEWLGAPDSSGNFHAAREKHHGNTGSWFLGGEEYVKWKETPDSTLWVYGT